MTGLENKFYSHQKMNSVQINYSNTYHPIARKLVSLYLDKIFYYTQVKTFKLAHN